MGLNNPNILGKKYIYIYIFFFSPNMLVPIMGLNNPILIIKAPIVGLKKPHLDP